MTPPTEKKSLPFPPGDDRAMGHYVTFVLGAAPIAGVAIAAAQFFSDKSNIAVDRHDGGSLLRKPLKTAQQHSQSVRD